MENSNFGFKFTEFVMLIIISCITAYTGFKAIEIYNNYQYEQQIKTYLEYYNQKLCALENYSIVENDTIIIKDTIFIEETINIYILDGVNPKCIDL